MTKRITKIIAALGVTTGLGVAALPLSSYAATSTDDVTVEVRIEPTTGTVSPECTTAEATVGAGEDAEDTCAIGGSSNTGITISISDSATGKNGTSLALTGYSDAFEGNTALTPAAAINPIASALDNSAFNVGSIASINGGAGGWGYRFNTGGTTGLTLALAADSVVANNSKWNPLTSTATTVASSTGGVTLSGAAFGFRAVTPPSQTPGFYSNAVTVTVTTQ